MVTYYRGRTALITQEVFEVRGSEVQRFTIEDLYDVRAVRGPIDPAARGSVIAASVLLAVIAISWQFLHSPVAWLAAVIVVAAPGAFGGAYMHMRPPVWELRATYRGTVVLLYGSPDAQTFGQVKRALVRALESHGG